MKKLIGTLSLMPFMAFATTWYVDGTNGTDENSGTSPSEAKATIQAAIDASSEGPQTGKYDCNNTPMLVWQDYVAGTDPTNPDDTFTATITMVEGVPQVAWKPVLTEEAAAKRVYRKFGKVKLTDEWAEISSGHEADYNFFKVTVEMP